MKKYNKKQFTLIELIIVIVVIGILAGMALPKFMGIQRDAKVAAMQQDIDTLEKAILLYNTNSDDNSYPISTKIDKTTLNKSLQYELAKINDDGNEIYIIDDSKLTTYIDRTKYPINDYCYSTKTNHIIYKNGKINSKDKTIYMNTNKNQEDPFEIELNKETNELKVSSLIPTEQISEFYYMKNNISFESKINIPNGIFTNENSKQYAFDYTFYLKDIEGNIYTKRISNPIVLNIEKKSESHIKITLNTINNFDNVELICDNGLTNVQYPSETTTYEFQHGTNEKIVTKTTNYSGICHITAKLKDNSYSITKSIQMN